MKRCLMVLLAVVAVLCCRPLRAQTQPQREVQIVQQVLTEISPLRNIASSVNIDALGVSYQEGKVLEQSVTNLKQDILTSQLVSKRILSQPRLSDQILLMGLLGNIDSDIEALRGAMLEFAPVASQKPGYQTWEDRATDAMNLMMHLNVEQMNYVTARADQIEGRGCK